MVRFHSSTIAVAVAATTTTTIVDIVNATPNLNHALVRDVLPPQSTKCSSATTTTTFEFDFNNVNASASNWNPLHKDQEHLVFLAEISNGLDPDTHDNGWKLRVGQAGVIYSLLGKFGEALPPQGGVHSPWNDEVWQQTMTHRPLNHDSTGGLYMIHQAGVYLFDDALSGIYPSPYVLNGDKDSSEDATATISCDNNSCAFVSWGQQAHIPTPHPSNALYYTRVADCGNGVIEYTMVTHNMKVSPTVTSDFYDLFTTPWMGVRGETFRDVLTTEGRTITDGAVLVKPKPIFQTNGRPNMEDTLGYIVFTQGIKDDEVLPDFEIPCTDPTNPFKSVDCKNDGTDLQAVLKAGKANFCVESKAHTAIYGRAVIRCTLEQTDEAKFGDLYGDILVSKAGDLSGDKLHMKGILYYALRGQFLFFVSRNFPNDMDWLNSKFTTGDQLVMEHTDVGYTYEENHALAAVYGTYHTMNRPTYMVNAGTYPTEDYLHGDWASSYIIFGQGASITRDVIVYGACHRGMLLEGETYRERSYFVIDKLSNIDNKAQEYTSENYRDIFKQDSPDMGTGQKITLFKYTTNDTTFGGCLSDTENCGQDTAEIKCDGWTTPKEDLTYMPLFSMSCGTTHYVGTDRYYFTPTDANHGYLRNYICDGEAIGTTPTYHLLGYFPYGTCDALQGTKFDQMLCTSTDGGGTSPTVAAPTVAEAPVEPVPAPIEPVPTPVAEPVEAPVEPVPAPVAEAPVEPVPAPVEPVPAPVEPPVEAPVEPAPAPVVAPVEAPVEPVPAPFEAPATVITEGEYDCTNDPFMYLFELYLEIDHLGSDTTWEVIDIMNGQSVMYSGGPYTGVSNQGYKYGKCLPKLSCYKFVIHDLSEDGITGEGNGVIVKWNHIEEMNTIDQPSTNNLQFSHDGIDFGMSCAPTGGALMSTPYYSDISNGVYGIMFDIKSKKDIVFRRFHALHLASSSSTTPVDYKVYTKNGSYKGYEHLPNSWSLVHHETLTSSSGLNTWTYASNFASPVTALDGTTQAFYIALDQKILLTGDGQTLGLNHGDSYQTYGDFDVLVGDVFDTTPSDGAFTASDVPITPSTPAMFSGRFTYGTARINY